MKKIFFFFIVLFLFAKLLLLSSCANIIPPGGGPKDTLPPVLKVALPKDSITSFKGKTIILNFDEYVQLDNPQDNVVVSPNPANQPIIVSKLRTVTIKLRDSLLPNTTYTINFGNALKDVNEGNVYKNFTYVFSTGTTLAHQVLSGKVLLAETGEIDSALIVVLQSNLADSAIKKLRPLYYTRINGKGNFEFRNLPEGTFNVFALPNDYSKKYDDSTKVFAFLTNPVTLADSASKRSVTMYAYSQFKEGPKTSYSSNTDNNLSSADKKKKAEENKRLKLSTSLEGDKQDILTNLQISLSHKIKTFDSSKIFFTDTTYKPIAGAKFILDTSLKIVTLRYKWAPNTDYKILIDKNAFTDSVGTTLAKADTLNFSTKDENAYGSITLRFINLDLSKNPVLQIVKNNIVIDSSALTKNEWHRDLYEPGEYHLRILFDDNKNGTWDPGDYSKKKQPEIVQAIYKPINIKNDWENEDEINLNAPPPTSGKQQQQDDNDE